MASVCFIFPNSSQKLEASFTDDLTIRSVKQDLLAKHWPQGQISREKIDGLRFFCMGKELQDNQKLKDYSPPSPDVPIPIHVHIIKTSIEKPESHSDAKWCCSCQIF
ncbi:unnamed protein product [Blepharisma stoltei]|uniref:UBL3-like ubiquitin domain-containing protein n=1 Tax=Blepharisma stoltei TaxID=1481888 RepID=A0AAU9KA30_9CILI|nr:unnamed protein product [Blepharisma stoltei]